MAKPLIPFNIHLLNLNPEYLRSLAQVTDLNIFDSSKEVFHPKGLFSDEIFGPVGSEVRYHKFAYIDVKLEVLHPIIYRGLTQSRKFYAEIMSGSSYATFSSKEKDFIKSDPLEGETGFNFFMNHYPSLELADTGTDRRTQVRQLLEKYRNTARISKIIVLPAGLRDVEFEDGRPTYDDINQFYKRLISLSNNIPPHIAQIDPSLVDITRFKIQQTFNDLYDNLSERIEGKKKLYLGKWASRRIFNGTRNVITSTTPSGRYLNDKYNVGFNDMVVGLYQMMKSILPVSIYNVQNSILQDIFPDPNTKPKLINKESLELEEVEIDSRVFDYYQSQEGIESFITDYEDEGLRHAPLMVGENYLALTYTGEIDNKKVFKIFRDINTLPPECSRDDVHPTTYTEFFYSVMYKVINSYPAITVRYPITGSGSTVPTTVVTKTTIPAERRYELDDSWRPNESSLATEFPILGLKCQESMSPPIASLAGLTADFDGDVMSLNVVYSDEAREEVQNFLNSKKAYLTPMGNFIKSVNVDTVKYVCYNLSE